MRRSRRFPEAGIALALLACSVLAGPLGCERPVPASEIPARLAALGRPHLVLIVVDTLRADYTTPYGCAEDTTPELARWAERGVVFERDLAQSSWTKISVASLLTSLWPRSHGIHASTDGLGEAAVTLAETLRQAGYRTYGVQTNGWLHQSFGFHQGFDRYVFPMGKGARLPKASIWPSFPKVEEEARRLVAAHPREEPFFLYLHFMDVHEFASPQDYRRYGTDSKGAYLASIRWVDDGLARLREMLEDEGVLDRTVIVFASDHGEAFGENGKTGHARNVLTPVLWVPLVMRFPFTIDPPVRVATQVRNVDIAPTLLDLANVPIPESFEGSSLLPLLGAGDDAGGDRPNFAALGTPLYMDASVQVSVNDGAWTYARNVEPDLDRSEFLFNRSVDPREDVNLIAHEDRATQRMRELLDAHLAEEPASAVLRENIRIDPEIERRLWAMGYLQGP
jgi:arylsulfatase A-like enzyme